MWTSPVPIPSRIPSTPWKTDTRTAGSGLPSSFPSCPHSAVRTTPAPCVTFNRSIPAGCSFFCPPLHTSPHGEGQIAGEAAGIGLLHTSPHGEGTADRTARQKREARTRSLNVPLSCPCLSYRAGPSPAVRHIFPKARLPDRPFPAPASGSPLPPLRPRPSGLRPLSPRAKISFCPCPAAGTGAPVRPRASASTVPAGDAVQTLPRIIP